MEEPINTPISSPKPSNNKLFKILIIIIGFLIAIGLFLNAYLLLKKSKQPFPIGFPVSLPTPIIPSPTLAPNSTANWKTYVLPSKTGETCEIKYPPTWQIREADGPSSFSVEFSKEQFPEKGLPTSNYIDLLRFGNEKGVSLDNWLGEMVTGDSTFEVTKSSFGGKEARFVISKRGGGKSFYVVNGEYIFEVTTIVSEATLDSETERIFTTMLSTFKFTDSTDSISNWNTYSSTKFGFTIKYPKMISKYNESWQYEEIGLGSTGTMIGFGAPSSKSGGYIWGVGIFTDKTVEQLIKEQGQQFTDRKESRKNIVVNGKSALFVTVTTNQYPDWISKTVYVEQNGKIYVISNGAVEIPEFDYFYNSFATLN